MKGIQSVSLNLNDKITQHDINQLKKLTEGMGGKDRLKIDRGIITTIKNGEIDKSYEITFTRTSKTNLEKLVTIFEKTKNNISNNKSMFHKTELTENIFNHSSVSLKKLNTFLSENDPKAKIKKDREISDTLETIKSAIYRHNGTANTNKINTKSFEIIARNMLTNSTAPHSKQDLMNTKNDLKELKDYMPENKYYALKNSLDERLKAEK